MDLTCRTSCRSGGRKRREGSSTGAGKGVVDAERWGDWTDATAVWGCHIVACCFAWSTRCQIEFMIFGDGLANVELIAETRKGLVTRFAEWTATAT